MPILDKDTKYDTGTGGTVNNMRIQQAPDGKTVLHFVHYTKVTGDHVDEAEIIGEVVFGEVDVQNFNKLLTNHIKKYFNK